MLTAEPPNGDDERAKKEQEAQNDEAAYLEAEFRLRELRDVDIRLLRERFRTMKGKARGTGLKELRAIRKATGAALDALPQQRNTEQANAMCEAIAQRLKTIEDSPLGDSTRARNELPKVRERWRDTIDSVHKRLDQMPGLVRAACGQKPSAEDYPDEAKLRIAEGVHDQLLRAADDLWESLIRPIKEMLRVDAFDATIERLAVADEYGALDAREDGLREIRRLRRLMVSDPRVRMAAESPFEAARVPFRSIETALWDVETNLLISDM
ncbi:hypothetical protein [Bradyrhizobium sp. SZCCHNS3051]|uniref:hypothetical protein n=1 Tax=Bradyrhizobium sp. SZCCHNS3051 TaxID=3057320 RepID=UPI00291642F4|nr:hypothetical protein [Bradyrhizobium sp. SZCCHNS3051]